MPESADCGPVVGPWVGLEVAEVELGMGKTLELGFESGLRWRLEPKPEQESE